MDDIPHRRHEESVADSPVRWVADHIRSYLESGGSKGHRFRGADALLLTTRGRKSGRLRRTALYYARSGDAYLVVASNGGSSKHPLWYLNLLAHPRVEVQVGGDVFEATARPANAEERPSLWPVVTAAFPPYQGMQRKTRREIPVVILEPISPTRDAVRRHGSR
jgi:deazaflavin-dependent oxidoreductase (nitroreductase family)